MHNVSGDQGGREENIAAGKHGSRENVSGAEHGGRLHKHAGSHVPFSWPTQPGGPDSWTSCPDYTQMRRCTSPTSHQKRTTPSSVSPRATLATFPPWELPKALTLPLHLWGDRLGLFPGLVSSFLYMCLLVCYWQIKNKWGINNLLKKLSYALCSWSPHHLRGDLFVTKRYH